MPEGQMMNWLYSEFVRAITSTFMHGFQDNLVFLKSKSAIENFFT